MKTTFLRQISLPVTRSAKRRLAPFYENKTIKDGFVKIRKDPAVELKVGMMIAAQRITNRRASVACSHFVDEQVAGDP